MEKVAAYVRVSSHPDSAHSVLTQTIEIEEFCKSNGYKIYDSALIVNDRNSACPEFCKLLKTASRKGITKIVMTNPNRIVCSADEIEEARAAIIHSGVTIETLDGKMQEFPNINTTVEYFLANADLDAQADSSEENGDNNL